MDKTAWLEVLLPASLSFACIRPHGFDYRRKMLWLSLVTIMLVLGLEHQLPLAIEIMVVMVFLIFIVFPVQALVKEGR